VLILKIGVLCLLLLPLLSWILPAVPLVVPALPANAAPALAHSARGAADAASASAPAAGAPLSMPLVYGIGVALLVLHFVTGIGLLALWTNRAREVTHGAWHEILARSARGVRARLLASSHVPSPLSWGLFRPAILVDEQSLADTASAPAIIAHELAHIRNHDWATLFVARIVLALFWFNPLTWLVVRALEQQMEEAADLAAARQIGAPNYAQTLVLQGRRIGGSTLPALAMAARPSRLSHRVGSLLRGPGSTRSFDVRGKLVTAAAAGLALVSIAMLAVVGGRAVSSTPRHFGARPNAPAALRHLSARPRTENRRTSTVIRVWPAQPSSQLRDARTSFDAAAHMDQQAAIVDEQASAVDEQARELRAQAAEGGETPEAREQAQQQAATLETAAAAMRTSAAGTRANAIATRRNQRLETRLSQAP
jgi:beta-lactamase regulating signal transducer with metallopeptidase domain